MFVQKFLARTWNLELKGSTVCKVWRGMGPTLLLTGEDASRFKPQGIEPFAAPLPSRATLEALASPVPIQAMPPNESVGPGQARKADRQLIQHREATLESVAPQRTRNVAGRRVRGIHVRRLCVTKGYVADCQDKFAV